MATNFRVEFVRLRGRDSNGLQNIDNNASQLWGNQSGVQKTITGTALTGAGRVTVPANVSGLTRFHARINSTVECLVTIAPAGDAGTSYDATSPTIAGAISIPANTPTLLPVQPGQLISASTGVTFA